VGPDQLSALYDKYGYSVHQRCLHLLGNRADAEDAVQDVFVRVRSYHGSLKAPVTLAWLHAIANHVCFDKAKRRAREEPWEPPELAELDPRRLGAPEDADRRALVSSVMGQLDQRMRDIVILHHIEGWTPVQELEVEMCSTRTWEGLMRKFLRASMGAISAAMLMTGCGEGLPVLPDYRGEPLVTLQGQLRLADHIQVDEPVRLALVWYKSSTDLSKPREIVTQDIAYEPSFPIAFTFHLYTLPPPEALSGGESGRFGHAILVAYRDDNHNGELDPIPAGGVPQDKVLGATQSFFNREAPGYALSYSEGTGGQNGRFTLSRFPVSDSNPMAEPVPLDTPITLTLTGEDELAALICMTGRTSETAGSPNPLAFCGLPATPGILRLHASFIFQIEGTPTGENVRGHSYVRLSDGSRWLTDADATVTLNGHPLPVGRPDTTPGTFPAPGAVSTLIVSAPGFPTATYEIRVPGTPRLTSPASGATFPSGSSLHFAWSPVPFFWSSRADVVAGADSTLLWSEWGPLGASSAPPPPSPFDITTRPIAYTGDAFARLTVFNQGNSSRYGGSTWSEVQYTHRITFTP